MGACDEDAVVLKNGANVCHSCYQKHFAPKAGGGPSGPVFRIDPWAVAGLVGLLALGAFTYKIYRDQRKDKIAQETKEHIINAKREKAIKEQREDHERRRAKMFKIKSEQAKADRLAAEAAKLKIENRRLALKDTLALQRERDQLRRTEEMKKREDEALQKKLEEEARLRARHEEKMAEIAAQAERERSEKTQLAKDGAQTARRALPIAQSKMDNAQRNVTAYKNLLAGTQRTMDNALKLANQLVDRVMAQYQIGTGNGRNRREPWSDFTILARKMDRKDQVRKANGTQVLRNRQEDGQMAGFKNSYIKALEMSHKYTEKLTAAEEAYRISAEEYQRLRAQLKASEEQLMLLGLKTNTKSGDLEMVAEKTAAKTPAAQEKNPVYVLKSGKQISAVTTVDSGDVIVIKDEKGKFHRITKADIKQIKDK